MKDNWDRSAMRFASARYIQPEEMLEVVFENGDHFLIAVESVLSEAKGVSIRSPSSARENRAPLDWLKLRIGETGDVLEVPTDDAAIEIAWDRIRSIADAKFRAHLAERVRERTRRLGDRVRAMRLEAELTPTALAEKVGVPRQTIIDLEAGNIEPRTDLIDYIALALGKRLRDFGAEQY